MVNGEKMCREHEAGSAFGARIRLRWPTDAWVATSRANLQAVQAYLAHTILLMKNLGILL